MIKPGWCRPMIFYRRDLDDVYCYYYNQPIAIQGGYEDVHCVKKAFQKLHPFLRFGLLWKKYFKNGASTTKNKLSNSLLFQVFIGGPFLPYYCACHLSRGISNRSSAYLLWVQHRLEYWKLEKWWKKLIFDKAFQQSRIENILTFWFLKKECMKWKGIHTFILQEYPRAWHLKQIVTVIFHLTAKI